MLLQITYPVPSRIVLQTSRLSEEYLCLHHHLGDRQASSLSAIEILANYGPPHTDKGKVILNSHLEDVGSTRAPRKSSRESVMPSPYGCHWRPSDSWKFKLNVDTTWNMDRAGI